MALFCPVCDGTGFLLEDQCPLCEGDKSFASSTKPPNRNCKIEDAKSAEGSPEPKTGDDDALIPKDVENEILTLQKKSTTDFHLDSDAMVGVTFCALPPGPLEVNTVIPGEWADKMGIKSGDQVV